MKNGEKRSVKNFAIVPAFNEEETIVEVITRLKSLGIKPIVVDDHSTDRTATLARTNGATVIKHMGNRGKGHAMRAGLDYLLNKHPEAEHIVFIDADMQYTPEDAQKMVELLEDGKSDFITGYRNWNLVPFRHSLGNFVWRSTFNILFGTRLKDTNCGLMALKKNAIEKIKDSITGGYIIENSIIIEALKNDLRIEQIPVPVFYKKVSRIKRGIKTVAGVLLFIIKEGLKYRLSNFSKANFKK